MYFISLNLLCEAFPHQKFKANVLLNNLAGIIPDGNMRRLSNSTFSENVRRGNSLAQKFALLHEREDT